MDHKQQVSPEVIPAQDIKLVIFGTSLGTVFEWYDFYLYGSLAIFFSAPCNNRGWFCG